MLGKYLFNIKPKLDRNDIASNPKTASSLSFEEQRMKKEKPISDVIVFPPHSLIISKINNDELRKTSQKWYFHSPLNILIREQKPQPIFILNSLNSSFQFFFSPKYWK